MLLAVTYIEIQTPARRLEASLDEIARPLSNAVERLWADNVCVGVAVCEDALSSCVLSKVAAVSEIQRDRDQVYMSRWTHIVLVQGGKHGPRQRDRQYTLLHLSRTRKSTSCHRP